MLARSFLSAQELDITETALGGLIKTLHALERGELVHVPAGESHENGFHMTNWHCGSTHCIGGWAEEFAGQKHVFEDAPPKLFDLFYPGYLTSLGMDIYHECTPVHAALALSNYLTTGEPNWAEVMKP